MKEIVPGSLLISEPFLPDPNFHRTVILVLEHGDEGSVGLVLNQKGNVKLNALFEETSLENWVYVGGPVGKNNLLYVHTVHNLSDAAMITPGLFWGGNFEHLKLLFEENLVSDAKIRFFAGYSGWSPGQLEAELDAKSWIVAQGQIEDVFCDDEMLWKNVLHRLGGEFRWLGNAPEDVSLN
jgi:putative transcriptional regulator